MDLTTLQRVKDYLAGVGVVSTGADNLYNGLISRMSDVCMEYCGRTFQRSSFVNQALHGSGSCELMLPVNPVISVSSLKIDGSTIPVSPDGMASGYQYDQKFLYLFGGFYFTRARRNVLVSYVAGYATSQSGFIPANPGPYTITPTQGNGLDSSGAPNNTSGPAVADLGVVFTATGAALVQVGSNPATGQYSFSGGVYTFAAADTGRQVTMSYDYVPGMVEQACLELIGTKLKQRDNLGISSKTLGPESVSYMDKDLPSSVKGMLDPYRFLITP